MVIGLESTMHALKIIKNQSITGSSASQSVKMGYSEYITDLKNTDIVDSEFAYINFLPGIQNSTKPKKQA